MIFSKHSSSHSFQAKDLLGKNKREQTLRSQATQSGGKLSLGSASFGFRGDNEFGSVPEAAVLPLTDTIWKSRKLRFCFYRFVPVPVPARNLKSQKSPAGD